MKKARSRNTITPEQAAEIETEKLIRKISRVDAFEKRLPLIEQLLKPLWLSIHTKLQRFGIPFLKDAAEEAMLQEQLKPFLYSINTVLAPPSKRSKIQLGPSTPEEAKTFHEYIIENNFPSFEKWKKWFRAQIAKDIDTEIFINGELEVYKKMIEELNRLNPKRLPSTADYYIEKRYDWQQAFYYGFSTAVTGAEALKLTDDAIKLLDLYFYQLGRTAGAYYKFVKAWAGDAYKADLPDVPISIKSITLTVGERLMLLDHDGTFAHIKSLCNAETYTTKKVYDYLFVHTGINLNSLKAYLRYFNHEAGVATRKEKDNPREYESHYLTCIEAAEKIGLPEVADSLRKEMELRRSKGLLRFH